MQQSNGYVVISTVILTVICASLLAGVKLGLTNQHEMNAEVDSKSKILAAYEPLPAGLSNQEILDLYDKHIEGVVVNGLGEPVLKDEKGNDIDASKVDVFKNFKETDPAKKQYPVFKFKSKVHDGQYAAYIVPVYGNGLWDYIWGYVALETDFNTIKGAIFDHKGETPGLGARITDADVQARFIGKKITDAEGNFQSVRLMKGEGHDASELNDHLVDGLSGATMTANGVNDMLNAYFNDYQVYFEMERKKALEAEKNTPKTDLRNDI